MVVKFMESKKPVNVFAAYQQMLERSKLQREELFKKREFPKEKDQENNIPRRGQGGAATNYPRRVPELNRLSQTPGKERHVNTRYMLDTLKHPLYKETGSASSESGIFSNDEGAVLAAIDKGVPTNKPINSKLIPSGLVSIGLFEGGSIEVGMVDALTWQCYLGCDRNVVHILKAGYKPQRKYSGMNPITAAIKSKNLQVLKLVLHYAPLKEIVNDKDGFGERPIQTAAQIAGIDPYEFAREVVRAGGHDKDYKNGEYSALMLTVLRTGNGAIWTPNIFGEILQVSDVDYKAKGGITVKQLAKSMNNKEALVMLHYFDQYGDESLNKAILDNDIAF